MPPTRFSRGLSDYQIKMMFISPADDDFTHLDEYLPASLVALSKFPPIQGLNARATAEVYWG